MRWVSVAIPLKCLVQFFGFCLSSLVGWQHLVGVVQRNQPCLHGHPMGWIEFQVLVLFPFNTQRSSHWYSKCKSAFSNSSTPLFPFAFLPPANMHWSTEGTSSSYCNASCGLGSFLILCNKLLPSNQCLLFFYSMVVTGTQKLQLVEFKQH